MAILVNVSYRKLRAIDLGNFYGDLQNTLLCSNPVDDIDNLILQYITVLKELIDMLLSYHGHLLKDPLSLMDYNRNY